MLKKMIMEMLPPGAFDEIIGGAQQAMTKISEFDQTLLRIERRLYNIEVDIQTILTGEVQAEKIDVSFSPQSEGKPDGT